MLELKEDLLQFIWKHKLLRPGEMHSHDGQKIEVVQSGEQNLNAGPDFSNSQVRINGLLMAGNVEIHVKTSDWLKHKHQSDKSYDNLILHVVHTHDTNLQQNKDFAVPVLEI